jgi:hypothetical protein
MFCIEQFSRQEHHLFMNLKSNRTADIRLLLFFYAPLFLVLAIAGYVGTRGGRINVQYLTRDPASTMAEPFYIGCLSNIGVIGWCMAAAACLFSYAVLKGQPAGARWSGFFLFAGILSAVLGLDDLFLFHEEIFPNYIFSKKSAIRLNEKFVLLTYAAGMISFLVKYRHHFKETRRLFLLVAIGFLGASVLADRGFMKSIIPNKQLRVLAEDGLKLLGVLGWAHYFWLTGISLMRSCAAKPPLSHASD